MANKFNNHYLDYCPPEELDSVVITADPIDSDMFNVVYTFKSRCSRENLDRIKTELMNKKSEILSSAATDEINLDALIAQLNSL